MNPSDARKFCTCGDTSCPNHPANHDAGCTPCILKNLTRREIPSCFFNMVKAGDGEKLKNYYFEDFAAAVEKFNKTK